MTDPAKLLPAENMALTVARGQLARGENPPANTTAMLVMALDRLAGHSDWMAEAASAGPAVIPDEDLIVAGPHSGTGLDTWEF